MSIQELLRKSKPIVLDVNDTKAILNGQKTQIRIPIKIDKHAIEDAFIRAIDTKEGVVDFGHLGYMNDYDVGFSVNIPFLEGDILWVREQAKVVRHIGEEYPSTEIEYLCDGAKVWFDNFSENEWEKDWLVKCKGVPNGCTKKMARIFLKITNMRIERLQNIIPHDIYAEGIIPKNSCTLSEAEKYAKEKWINAWNRKYPIENRWEDNPFVFVFDFERLPNARSFQKRG